MIQDFSTVPKAGRNVALFFNAVYLREIEFALNRDIPGKYALYRRRAEFPDHLPEGCVIPDSVPIVPDAPGEPSRRLRARSWAMLVADMEPVTAYARIRYICEGGDDGVNAYHDELAAAEPAPDSVRRQAEIDRWETLRKAGE